MAAAAPARRTAPTRRLAPAPAPVQQRVLVAVRDLPDSGMVVRMSRGQLWIGVLGTLLAGIVALNVLSLSLGTSSGQLSSKIESLEQQNSALRADLARRLANGRVQDQAARLGLAVPGTDEIGYLAVRPGDATEAARRLAAGLLGTSVPAELIPGGAAPVAPTAPAATSAPTAVAPYSGGGATTAPAPSGGGNAGGVGA